MLISEPSLRTTASSISTLAWQLAKLGFEAIVVATPDSSLALLVIVSPAVKDPEGTVIVIVVELGLDITVAVVPLEDPVITLPTNKSVDAPTVAVIVPNGYAATAEDVE
jgi:hypothetical protein